MNVAHIGLRLLLYQYWLYWKGLEISGDTLMTLRILVDNISGWHVTGMLGYLINLM